MITTLTDKIMIDKVNSRIHNTIFNVECETHYFISIDKKTNCTFDKISEITEAKKTNLLVILNSNDLTCGLKSQGFYT